MSQFKDNLRDNPNTLSREASTESHASLPKRTVTATARATAGQRTFQGTDQRSDGSEAYPGAAGQAGEAARKKLEDAGRADGFWVLTGEMMKTKVMLTPLIPLILAPVAAGNDDWPANDVIWKEVA